jgi:hypothetical protein
MVYLDNGWFLEKLNLKWQWSNEAEAWHQWQLAYTRQNLSSYTYTNEALKQDAAL